MVDVSNTLTLASNLCLDMGIFSGPPYASKCLHPALALMYLGC